MFLVSGGSIDDINNCKRFSELLSLYFVSFALLPVMYSWIFASSASRTGFLTPLSSNSFESRKRVISRSTSLSKKVLPDHQFVNPENSRQNQMFFDLKMNPLLVPVLFVTVVFVYVVVVYGFLPLKTIQWFQRSVRVCTRPYYSDVFSI